MINSSPDTEVLLDGKDIHTQYSHNVNFPHSFGELVLHIPFYPTLSYLASPLKLEKLVITGDRKKRQDLQLSQPSLRKYLNKRNRTARLHYHHTRSSVMSNHPSISPLGLRLDIDEELINEFMLMHAKYSSTTATNSTQPNTLHSSTRSSLSQPPSPESLVSHDVAELHSTTTIHSQNNSGGRYQGLPMQQSCSESDIIGPLPTQPARVPQTRSSSFSSLPSTTPQQAVFQHGQLLDLPSPSPPIYPHQQIPPQQQQQYFHIHQPHSPSSSSSIHPQPHYSSSFVQHQTNPDTHGLLFVNYQPIEISGEKRERDKRQLIPVTESKKRAVNEQIFKLL